MATLIRRVLADDSGQDLVEYALLTAFVGLVGLVAFGITDSIGGAYDGMTANTNDLWETPSPAEP